jgi:hypothetical protein
MKSFKTYMIEKLSVSDGQDKWIEDFLKSDAPQFKGKSKEEIVKMAVAAFNSAKKNEEEVNEEAPVNSTGPAIDMNPTGRPKKQDKRSRFDVMKMYRRAIGVK